jgi:hypothetical protein
VPCSASLCSRRGSRARLRSVASPPPSAARANLERLPGQESGSRPQRESTRYLLKGANHGDLTFLGNAKAALPWSTQQVMALIVSFLHQHLGS